MVRRLASRWDDFVIGLIVAVAAAAVWEKRDEIAYDVTHVSITTILLVLYIPTLLLTVRLSLLRAEALERTTSLDTAVRHAREEIDAVKNQFGVNENLTRMDDSYGRHSNTPFARNGF